MPRSPDEMPDEIFLSARVLGDAEAAIMKSEKDRRERVQSVYWCDGLFRTGKMGRGSGGLVLEAHMDSDQTLFGESSLFLLYHTHPRYSHLSALDVAAFFRYGPLIELVFRIIGEGVFGVEAMLATEKSQNWRLRLLKN